MTTVFFVIAYLAGTILGMRIGMAKNITALWCMLLVWFLCFIAGMAITL